MKTLILRDPFRLRSNIALFYINSLLINTRSAGKSIPVILDGILGQVCIIN